MSDDNSPTEDEADSCSSCVSIQLTRYVKTATLTRTQKPTTKDKKSEKKKELTFVFRASKENYVQFLDAALTKHGEEKFAGTKFGFKVQIPPAKKSEAVDVENYKEYEEFVNSVIEQQPSKLSVYIDMNAIAKAFKARSSGDQSGDEDEDQSATSGNMIEGYSPLDHELGRLRRMLENEYKNEADDGYTYVGRDDSFPLTPQMMNDWCMAMYEGKATVKIPPSLPSFDPVNRQVALHPSRLHLNHPHAQSASSSSPSDVVGILQAVGSIIHGNRRTPSLSSLPETPRRNHAAPEHVASPPANTPGKLNSFLQYAQEKLGVPHALAYEQALEAEGYGPDILNRVEDKVLVGLGIRAGDAIRLKDGAPMWWNGPEAKKRKRTDSAPQPRAPVFDFPPYRENWEANVGNGVEAGDGNRELRADENNSGRVAFEYRSPTSQARYRYNGPGIKPGEPSQRDRNSVYLCAARNEWLPLPPGYVPIAPYNDVQHAADDDFGGSSGRF